MIIIRHKETGKFLFEDFWDGFGDVYTFEDLNYEGGRVAIWSNSQVKNFNPILKSIENTVVSWKWSDTEVDDKLEKVEAFIIFDEKKSG